MGVVKDKAMEVVIKQAIYKIKDNPDENMPYALSLAHKLSKRLTDVRKNGDISYLRPDGKTQVTIEYENDKPKRIETILISTQHTDNVDNEKIRKDITEKVIDEVVSKEMIDEHTKIYINPTGRFVIGGPLGDTGLTGRKLIVDTLGKNNYYVKYLYCNAEIC